MEVSDAGENPPDELFLTSIAEFRELIFDCFEIAGVRTIAEVGAWQGAFTEHLAAWAKEHQARVYSVEPNPTGRLTAICESSPQVDLIVARSPDAFAEFEVCDAYILDTDHNYYTVNRELTALDKLARSSGKQFVILLQDIGWPFGRRDSYGDASLIPSEALRPHSFGKGVVLDSTELVDTGFRGNWAWADQQGGASNGTMTALEDFLRDRPHLQHHIVPCIFYLAIIYPRSLPAATALGTYLRAYDNNALLARLEHNRLALYLRVLDLQQRFESTQHGEEEQAARLLEQQSSPGRRLIRRLLPKTLRHQLRRLIG
ncbi:MAG TPA: class I SAM-dependent methyltransferase [Dehalococcoidia bacterium]|nr:class I SAM-dependent methyltransferase [Dehalococcoidia bacterium]